MPQPCVGPSAAVLDDIDHQLDVFAAVGDGASDPSARTVVAIGEAKARERICESHLRRLERARAALGPTAANARLLLFAPEFSDTLMRSAEARDGVELIDLHRSYSGN